MSASVQSADLIATPAARRLRRLGRIDATGLLITLVTLIGAIIWAFPLYWGLVTTFKHEYEIVRPGFQLWPEHFTFENYVHVLLQTKIGYWYINSAEQEGYWHPWVEECLGDVIEITLEYVMHIRTLTSAVSSLPPR